MRRSMWVRAMPSVALAFAGPAAAAQDDADTLYVQGPDSRYEVVVSATRTPRNQVNIPNATAVVTGQELRRRGTRTLAEALQDVVGLDTGAGSDNGARLPNVGMWGLKEFDALLFTLNGVPVGGPFNPSLSQIPVEDVDRIEIVKGPQGTLYGVSAFAGMVQVFTSGEEEGRGHAGVSGGSFGQGRGSLGWGSSFGGGRDLRVSGAFERSDGWQDRTATDVARGGATLGWGLGRGRMTLELTGYRDRQDWGTPLPYEAGAPVPGFDPDRNYAVGGAEVRHQVLAATSRWTLPLRSGRRIENTLGFTHDDQRLARSFPGELAGDTLESQGVEVEPRETALYEDLRLVAGLKARGEHELVAGAALTWGETRGEGSEFEFDQALSAYPAISSLGQITARDDRDFEDRRTFLGLYAHDSWTPVPRFTLGGGARLDATSEELETEVDLAGGPQRFRDERQDQEVSGDLSALVRLAPEGGPRLQAANLYASLRTGFKPAAPNLSEAEAAEILEPERTRSWEVGFKSRAFEELAFEASYFDMRFENLVVSILGPSGGPELTNAGAERFRGFETQLRWTARALPGLGLDAGYAHHDARYEDFTFVTPDSQLVDVGGKRVELTPRDLFNARASFHSRRGPGAFAALRWQGQRPLNRRNRFFTGAYAEWDAGLSFERGRWSASLVGRNLGDDRHVTTESEIGDSQFYIAAPRRFAAELAYRF